MCRSIGGAKYRQAEKDKEKVAQKGRDTGDPFVWFNWWGELQAGRERQERHKATIIGVQATPACRGGNI